MAKDKCCGKCKKNGKYCKKCPIIKAKEQTKKKDEKKSKKKKENKEKETKSKKKRK